VPAFFFYRNWLFTFFKLQKVKSWHSILLFDIFN
jgi:hypothetical protein